VFKAILYRTNRLKARGLLEKYQQPGEERLTSMYSENALPKEEQKDVVRRAREYIAEAGYDPSFGARPLKRVIQRELQDPLALKILAGEFEEGDIINVERGHEGLTFSVTVPVVEGEVVA